MSMGGSKIARAGERGQTRTNCSGSFGFFATAARLYVGPHVMIVLPDSAKDALRGINQDLSNNEPYASLLSSADVATPIWVIPVAKGGNRFKVEPAK